MKQSLAVMTSRWLRRNAVQRLRASSEGDGPANIQSGTVTLDTDTTVQTLYGNQMGGRKGYNPKHKGKRSYQPMLIFIAETREYLWGGLRNGDRPSGKEIARHLSV